MKNFLVVVVPFAILSLGVAFSLQALRTSPVKPGVTPENFQQLYLGMTHRDVEAILGKPNTSPIGQPPLWNKNGYAIVIDYVEDDNEFFAYFGEMHIGTKTMKMRPRPKSFFEHIRGFLGL